MAELFLDEIGELAGYPRPNIDDAEFDGDFFYASAAGFSDDEMFIGHEPYDDPEKVGLYGRTMYTEGTVARNLLEAAIQNGPQQDTAIAAYQASTAESFARQVVTTSQFRLPKSAVQIEDGAFVASGRRFEVGGRMAMVVDYGPGLAGINHIQRQHDMLQAGQVPFHYFALARLPFTIDFLSHYYEHLMPGLAQMMISRKYYLARMDGMAAASNDLVSLQEASGESGGIDLVMATGIYNAKPEDAEVAVKNAFKLLRAGGSLVLRSVAENKGGEVTGGQLLDWAHQAGFESDDTQVFEDMGSRSLRHAMAGKMPRLIQTAVLLKT